MIEKTNKFILIEEEHKKKTESIDSLCHKYGVSKSGYYKYKNNKGKIPKSIKTAELITKILNNHPEYGYSKIKKELDSILKKPISRMTVARIVRKYNLKGINNS